MVDCRRDKRGNNNNNNHNDDDDDDDLTRNSKGISWDPCIRFKNALC